MLERSRGAQRPPQPATRGERATSWDVHELIPEAEELLRLQRLREEIRVVVCRTHEWHFDLEILHTFTDEEMTPFDMLRALMMLWIICEVSRSSVVYAETDGPWWAMAKLRQEAT